MIGYYDKNYLCMIPDFLFSNIPFPDILATVVLALRNDLHAAEDISTLKAVLQDWIFPVQFTDAS